MSKDLLLKLSGLNFPIKEVPSSFIKEKAEKPSIQTKENSTPILADVKTLDELKEIIEQIDNLPIKKIANKTVFADGPQDSKIMLIGEAPGANEDEQGIPFCGMSGKLLDRILSFINLSRLTNLYITNTIFWRPPANRKPSNDEIATCYPYLQKHIALIKPELILLAGSVAALTILKSSESIGSLRSQKHQYFCSENNINIPVRVIFHPSYLLRQPSQKKEIWLDLLKIKDEFKQLFS